MNRVCFVLAVGLCGAAVSVSGCSRQNPSVSPVVAVTSIPVIATIPEPTPTPDPVLKFRRAHEIPEWSHSQVVKHVSVKPGTKPIALTFDDGPWPQYTQQILAILAEHRAKSTFYMLGQMVQEYPTIALQVRDAGHAIGGHSWSHLSRPSNGAEEVARTNAEFHKVLGFTPSTFRPPYGFLKNGFAAEAMRQKQAVILWSSDSNDWKKPGAQEMTRTVLREASPGGIVLFHDGGGARRSTMKALPGILRELKNRGYHFVTVPELLRLRHIPSAPAQSSEQSTTQPVKDTTL